MTFSPTVEAHKESLMTQVGAYLEDAAPEVTQESIDASVAEYRKKAVTAVFGGSFSIALDSLEMARDARSGVIVHKVEGIDPPVLIRDARDCKETPVRSTESAEIQVLNAIRAAIEIADIEGSSPELKQFLQQYAAHFIETFSEKCEGMSPEAIQKQVKAEMAVVVGAMKDAGIEKPHKKLNLAKDFQNFNHRHFDIATISSVPDADGVPHTVVEAEVGLRELTGDQKAEYAAVTDPEQENPSWFVALPEWEQALVSKHADTIAEGKHTIPTQLREAIPGMRNASVKVTTVDGATVHESMHAGTLAHLGGSSEERQRLTTQNARQAQSYLPEGATLHTNTLNSRRPGGHDTEIIDRTTAAMEAVGGRQTGTAFNLFRLFGAANDTTGATQTLNQLADSVAVDGPATREEAAQVESIQNALKPRGFFGRMARGIGSMFSRAPSPESSIDSLVESGRMSEDVAAALRQGIGLRENVEAASATIRFGDRENVSLEVSTGVNLLTSALRGICERPEASAGLNTALAPKEVMLTMCASGKDRTGLSEHDQSARMVADRLGVDIVTVDVALLKGGHTGQVAGSVFAGGGTLGCHGTKSENKAGIPASRAEGLDSIIEVSSKGNKVKKPESKHEKKAKASVAEFEEAVEKRASELGRDGSYETVIEGTERLTTIEEVEEEREEELEVEEAREIPAASLDDVVLEPEMRRRGAVVAGMMVDSRSEGVAETAVEEDPAPPARDGDEVVQEYNFVFNEQQANAIRNEMESGFDKGTTVAEESEVGDPDHEVSDMTAARQEARELMDRLKGNIESKAREFEDLSQGHGMPREVSTGRDGSGGGRS